MGTGSASDSRSIQKTLNQEENMWETTKAHSQRHPKLVSRQYPKSTKSPPKSIINKSKIYPQTPPRDPWIPKSAQDALNDLQKESQKQPKRSQRIPKWTPKQVKIVKTQLSEGITASKKVENHRISDPLGPSESSWRSSENTILTFSADHQKATNIEPKSN